jgi:hypothetical protein
LLDADQFTPYFQNLNPSTPPQSPTRSSRGDSESPFRSLSKVQSNLGGPSAASCSRRPLLAHCKTGSSTKSNGSIRSPDRFVPLRGAADNAIQNFRASKASKSLSVAEQLVRHNGASPDSFSPRRIVTDPTPRAPQSLRSSSGMNRVGGRYTNMPFT